MKYAAVSVLVCLSLSLGKSSPAQTIPAGTLLPVQLRSNLDSAKAKPGDTISATLEQEVSLPSGAHLRKGARVSGRIVEVAEPTKTSPAKVTLRFDQVRAQPGEIGISVSLRALASMDEVFDAQLPTNDVTDYGSSVADWNTQQVGGQAVYRRAGLLVSGADTVGRAAMNGEVWAVPRAGPRSRCIADAMDDAREQSLWIFSSDACGTYGYEQLAIQHAGRTAPVGQIVLSSPHRIQVRSGSGWLLVVVAAPAST